MADYLGIWDFDEFFIPRNPHTSLSKFLSELSPLSPASKAAHPFCFVELESESAFPVDSHRFPVIQGRSRMGYHPSAGRYIDMLP